MRIQKNSKRREGEKIDFTLSISDMMSGLLFIFIIILIYFVMEAQSIKNEFSSNRQVQVEVLRELKKRIEEKLGQLFEDENIKVEFGKGEDSLRLPEQAFFKSGEENLTIKGKILLKGISGDIFELLHCETSSIKNICNEMNLLRVKSFFIEGHSDCEPIGSKLSEKYRSNLHLSSLRSLHAIEEMTSEKEKYNLLDLKNLHYEPVISLSAYGEYRPVDKNDACPEKSKELKSADRRIEFRIVMHLPKLDRDDRRGKTK
jgi:chemotaxis protein MotB